MTGTDKDRKRGIFGHSIYPQFIMITSCLHNPFSSLFEDPSKVAIVSRFVTISLTVQSHAGELVITYTVTNTIHMRECRSSEFEIPVRNFSS